jgi:hypothetical protein
MTMTRKQFLHSLVWAGAGAIGASTVASTLSACGNVDDKQNVDAAMQPAGNCNANGTSIVIATNHGHAMTVSKADVAAATPKTYDIAGGSLHSHSVTITGAQFAMLAANTSITLVSTSDGTHIHNVTVTCA